jgi:hypothetical protein
MDTVMTIGEIFYTMLVAVAITGVAWSFLFGIFLIVYGIWRLTNDN